MKRIWIVTVALFAVFAFTSGAMPQVSAPSGRVDAPKVDKDKAGTWDEFFQGTITKIQGNKITVKDEKGLEKTFDSPKGLKAKVGDKVRVKGGIVENGPWGMDPKAPAQKPSGLK